jgi:hypothetical protein
LDTAHEAVKAKAEARRQREQAQAVREAEAAEKEAKVRKALSGKPKTLVEKHGPRLTSVNDGQPTGVDRAYLEILEVIQNKAPRLAETSMLNAFREVAKRPFLRSPASWKPKGKGRDTLFRGLCEHLLAKYPMPNFLWSAFFDGGDAATFAPFVGFVAGGGSVFEAVKNGLLPIPFTRKMCHDFMSTPSDISFLRALRRTAVLTSGGTERFLNVWVTSQAGRVLHSKVNEAFWMTVLEWFGKNPMVDPNQVGPLVDFILFRQRQDIDFSMKGRTVLAMIRGMEEWHATFSKEKAITGTPFKPSGFRPFETAKGYRDTFGNYITEAWRVTELLTSKALLDEGRKLNHCVYSYSWSVEKGQTSIWSMTAESPEGSTPMKMITIELRNDIRKVVQVRGKYNRKSTAREFQVLKEWAGLNNLELSGYL